MLNADVKLFEINLPAIDAKSHVGMIVSGCNAYMGTYMAGRDKVYSEWEENNYAYLNSNNYNGKVLELEICLQSNQDNIYADFYARCFTIRTDNGLRIKIDGFKHDRHCTKMNMYNQVVMGVGLFLKDGEYALLQQANLILIEGFFALKRVNNTYGIAMQLVKGDEQYEIQFANTYKMKGIGNINGLAH